MDKAKGRRIEDGRREVGEGTGSSVTVGNCNPFFDLVSVSAGSD